MKHIQSKGILACCGNILARKVAVALSRARSPAQADKGVVKGAVNITQIHGRWRLTQGRREIERKREGRREEIERERERKRETRGKLIT